MKNTTMLATATLAVVLGLPAAVFAQNTDEMIASAMSAGPSSIAEDATITDLAGNVLREGTNGWTCIPDNPDADGTDPWCFDAPWAELRAALFGGREPNITGIGIAYMLAGDAPVSNISPAETEPTADNQWINPIGSHIMLVAPGDDPWAAYSSDPMNGGPWIMWPDTPYEHLMVPIDAMGPEHMYHMPMDGGEMNHDDMSDHMDNGDME